MPAPELQIEVTIHFYSFFKDLTGCVTCHQSVHPGTALSELLSILIARFPKLEPMRNSMLIAVGVEYQDRNYLLKDADEVSLFPPVQGG